MQESQSSTDNKGTGVVSSNVHEEPSPVGKGRYIHMYGWMIYPKETLNNKFGNNAFGWMKESASKNGISVDIVFSDDLFISNANGKTEFIYMGKALSFPDFVIMRDYNYTISIQLENLGIRVVNSTLSMFNSRNKAKSAFSFVIISVPFFISSSILLQVLKLSNEIKKRFFELKLSE
jgi:hypothetical protein